MHSDLVALGPTATTTPSLLVHGSLPFLSLGSLPTDRYQVGTNTPPPDPPFINFIAHTLMCALHSTDLRAATPIGNNTLN